MNPIGRSLIIGGDSTLGSAIADYLFASGEDFIITTRRIDHISPSRIFLDLNYDVSHWRVPSGITIAYFCAAITSLEKCYQDPTVTKQVNVINTLRLIEKLTQKNIFVIFPSTNLVFDGSIPLRKTDDEVCPKTEYGHQKAIVENNLMHFKELVSVVRLTKVIHKKNPLLYQWISDIREGKLIHPFSDMVMAPLPISLAIETFHQLAKQKSGGLFQLSGTMDLTYEQVARHLAEKIRGNQDFIDPVCSSQIPALLEHVPKYTTLDSTKIIRELGVSIPDPFTIIDRTFEL